jgi:hypothetical protein
MEVPLKYYFANNSKVCVNFDKYTIDENGVIRNEKREALSYSTNKAGYHRVGVLDASGKRPGILIGRAIASTFLGPSPTPGHTADHIDRNRTNDILENIRWSTKKEQSSNRDMPETLKIELLIDRYGEEKTKKEWVEYFNSKNEKNHLGHKYTIEMIKKYISKKQHGFSYKEYPDLPGEIWKEISWSKNTKGVWKISDMNRVKYITIHAENVLFGVRLGLVSGYPTISINGKQWYCHILAFMTFFPEEYANKKPDEIVLHEDDDRMDFRPHKLRLGTQSENAIDAHNNGKHDGTLKERQKCASYINGVFEKEHESQHAAANYLKSIGFEKADRRNIGQALKAYIKEEILTRYGRTWVRI